jgi:hypothetical protein
MRPSDFEDVFGFVVTPSKDLAGSECRTRSLAQQSWTKYKLDIGCYNYREIVSIYAANQWPFQLHLQRT